MKSPSDKNKTSKRDAKVAILQDGAAITICGCGPISKRQVSDIMDQIEIIAGIRKAE